MAEIYTIMDNEQMILFGGHFIPTWDSSDHFNFVCAKHPVLARILKVQSVMPREPTIHFLLQCPVCGECGVRKIYPINQPSIGMVTLTNESVVKHVMTDYEYEEKGKE